MGEAPQAEANPQQAPTPLSFQSLKRYSTRFAPVNLYMSALNWLMPERVADKPSSGVAYPTGGEYVVDVDSYLSYRKHNHRLVDARARIFS